MIRIIAFLFALCFLTIAGRAQGQEPEKHAADISRAMKDSLKLTKKQEDEIYAINLQLHNNKVIARKSSLDRSIVIKDLQRIENSRDSLYRIVLQRKEYTEYKTKKKNLVKRY